MLPPLLGLLLPNLRVDAHLTECILFFGKSLLKPVITQNYANPRRFGPFFFFSRFKGGNALNGPFRILNNFDYHFCLISFAPG